MQSAGRWLNLRSHPARVKLLFREKKKAGTEGTNCNEAAPEIVGHGDVDLINFCFPTHRTSLLSKADEKGVKI